MPSVRGRELLPLETVHPQAARLAEIVECASEQGKFREAKQRLFNFSGNVDSGLAKLLITDWDLREPAFSACMEGRARTRVKADATEGTRLGVVVTPTFVLGEIQDAHGTIAVKRRIPGAVQFETLMKELDQMGNEPR